MRKVNRRAQGSHRAEGRYRYLRNTASTRPCTSTSAAGTVIGSMLVLAG